MMAYILSCLLFLNSFKLSKQFKWQNKKFSSVNLNLNHGKTSIVPTMMSASESVKRILVLGGSGFVGGSFLKEYSTFIERRSLQNESEQNIEIVSISRRGVTEAVTRSDGCSIRLISVKGDATNETAISDVFSKYGPFDVCVHSMGVLLDANSGGGLLNKYASGSGSEVSADATYDKITRLSAFLVLDALQSQRTTEPPVFVFISAAEAGWTVEPPVDWLRRYLKAKRQVEERLLSLNAAGSVRAVIFRPSLIWTWKRPQALISVAPFYAASKFGFPFVDRPTTLEDLVKAMSVAIQDKSVSGVKRFKDIDALAAQANI
jgi:nucleoside-diphosphate-sugar epimerase